MTRQFLLPLLVLTLLAPGCLAQAGLIAGTTVPISLPNVFGVVEWQGRIFVTGKGSAGAPHQIYELDAAHQVVGIYEQSAASSAVSFSGYFDGCVDPSTGLIYWGYADRVDVIDPATMVPPGTPGVPLTPLRSFANSYLQVFRGMAWDPNGDGGAGSIWTGDHGGPLFEVSATASGPAGAPGVILTTFQNSPYPNSWSICGLAHDSSTGTLWTSSSPDHGQIAEIDPVNGVLSGRRFNRARPGSEQLGLSEVSAGSPIRPPCAGPGVVLIGLDFGPPYEYSLYDTSDAALLLTGVNGGPKGRDVTMVPGGGVLEWSLESRPAGILSGAPAATILTIGMAATPPSDTTPFAPGFVLPLLPPFSTPGAAPGQPVIALADGLLGGAIFPILTNQSLLGLLPSDLTVDDPTAANTVIAASFPAGTTIYAQSVYLDGVNLRATNLSGWEFRQPDSVLVEAVGADSYNSDPTNGFFRVTNVTGVEIYDVTFDFSTSPNPLQSTMVFDTDQGGMAVVFEGGNSAIPGCMGTYRGGSDLSCGLVYDATNTVPATPCDPTANTGWKGSVIPYYGATDTFRKLKFRFTSFNSPSQVFEFDCDTDGGAGVNGSSMDGMVVRITTSTGALTGVLTADPTDPNRAFVNL